MAGFVSDVTPRTEALALVALELGLPWEIPSKTLALEESLSHRLASDLSADAPYPPYARSLRDGYAVKSDDVSAATPGTPTFLKINGEIAMGEIPKMTIDAGMAVAVPTGAALPEGSDAVVMLEDTAAAGEWVEVRSGVQSGENIIWAGEEIASGKLVLHRGDLLDFRAMSLLCTLGAERVNVFAPRISILSTGDEIMPVGTKDLAPGTIRDANGYVIKALLRRYGFDSDYRGIVSDEGAEFEKRFNDELARCDVLILSGGSSVGMRDHSARVLKELPSPGLIIRGINIVPGKPTLIAGSRGDKRLVVSLPGHPLSCVTVSFVCLIPLLLSMVGAKSGKIGKKLRLNLTKDLTARTGAEEFVPCRIENGKAAPLPAKSGYISALADADGFIRIPEDVETLRSGETAEVWAW